MKYLSYIKSTIIGLVTLFAFQLNAQDSIDELTKKLANTTDSKAKVGILNKLALLKIDNNNIREGIDDAHNALGVATEHLLRKEMGESLLIIAKAYNSSGQNPNSLIYYIQAVQEYEKIDDKKSIADTYEKIGILIKDWGVYDKALEYLLKAKNIRTELKDGEQSETLLADIANSYFLIEDYQNALSNYQSLLSACEKKGNSMDCLPYLRRIAEIYDLQKDYATALSHKQVIYEILKGKGTQDEAVALNNLGYAQKKLENYLESIRYFEEARKLQDNSTDTSDIARDNKVVTLTNLGVLYQNMGDYTSSIESFQKALKIRESEDNQKETAILANLVTKVYIDTKQYQEAKIVNDEAVLVSESGNYLSEMEKAYELRHELFQDLGESKKALKAYELYASIQAKAYSQKVQEKDETDKQRDIIEEIEQEQKLLLADKERKEIELNNIRLEAEKKEKENTLLKREKELEKTRSEAAILAKEKAEQDLKLARQQLIADKKDRELKELQQEQILKDLDEKRKQGEIEVLRKDKELLEKNNEILAQNEKIKAQQLEEQEAKQFYIYIGIVGVVFILFIVLVAFYIKRRDNNKLDRQNKMLHANEKKLMEVNESLKTAQVKVEKALVAEQNLNKEVQEKNEQLQANEEELRQNAEELAAINEQLGSTLTNLQETQSQLVQSEKMASLGQLVAGVAHEVNTPLGAIKASIGTITDSLNHSLETLPQLFHKLNDDEIDIFYSLLRRASVPKGPMTSREERKIRRSLSKEMDEKEIENASEVATVFVDIGVHDSIDEFLPLVKHEESEFILKVAYSIALQQKNSANIELAVKKASKVVFALKSYSRQDQLGEMTKADVRENIETVLTIYHNILKQGIEVHTYFDDCPQIDCYHDELSQVWTNLITNAIHAMNNKGQIDITIKNLGELVEVSIKDYGPGIPEEIRTKIFDPFFTTKKAGEGSGLGLDIVKTIVEVKHNGSISVDSTIGEGSTFTVTLPIVASKSTEQVVKEDSV